MYRTHHTVVITVVIEGLVCGTIYNSLNVLQPRIKLPEICRLLTTHVTHFRPVSRGEAISSFQCDAMNDTPKL